MLTKRKIILFCSLVILFLSAYLLISGSEVLTRPLYKNAQVPAGNIIAWAAIISLPLSIFLGIKKLRKPTGSFEKFISIIFKATIILSVTWMPVCYYLAGNLTFSFAEKEGFRGGQTAMKIFWVYSAGMVLLPILLLIISGISTLFKNKS